MRTARALTLTLASALAAVVPSAIACSSSPTERAGSSSDFALSLGSAALSMAVGETVTVHASPVGADGAPFTGLYTLAWASSNTAAVAVAADGTLTAHAAGSATVTATATRIDTGAGATATVAVTVGGSSPPPPPPPPTVGSTLRPDISGLCISAAAVIADGTWLMQADCTAAPLRFTETQDAGGTELRVAGTSFCIDLPNGSVANGDLLQLFHCDSSSDQRFSPIAYANGRRGFKAVTSGKCFDIKGATAAPGALVQQWSCGDTPEQRFSTDSSGGGDAGGADGGAPGCAPGTCVTATFSESTEDFPNPERGFSVQANDVMAADSSFADSLQYIHDGTTGAGPTTGMRIARTDIDIGPWRTQDISQAALNRLSSNLDIARTKGVKLVFNVAYGFASSSDPDAPLAQVQRHVQQLAPIFAAHADVTYLLHSSFIGPWGEWDSSTNGLDTRAGRDAVGAEMLKLVPSEIPVAWGREYDVFHVHPTPISAANAFDGSDQSRTGSNDDCYLTGNGDSFTFPPQGSQLADYTINQSQADQRAYGEALNEFVPFGGETCTDSQGAKQQIRTQCQGQVDELGRPGGIMLEGPRSHLSWLGFPDSPFTSAWVSGGCSGDVWRLMGYRFVLDGVSHDPVVQRGTVSTVKVSLHDIGWARVYSARGLRVVLSKGSATIYGESTQHLHDLPSQTKASSTFDVPVTIPADAATGTWTVSLDAPDVYPTTQGNDFKIRFANANGGGASWDAVNYRWNTGTSVTVQ